MVKRKNSKEAILDAAEAVVLDSGAGHLSLDIVAQKAGVSKGGLMYNFPTKKALLSAMMNRLMQQALSGVPFLVCQLARCRCHCSR